MKIHRTLIAASAITIIAAACTKQEQETTPKLGDEIIPEGFIKLQVNAIGDVVSKTAISDEGAVTWSAGDEIEFLYTGGSVAATTTSTGTSATFSAIVPDTGDLYAVYPASAGTLNSGAITINIPSTQTGAFAQGNFSAAKVNRSDNTASFQNVSSFLKVTVSNPDVRRIIVETATQDAPLAGEFDVTFDGYDVQVGECSEGSGRITLDVDGPGTYMISVVPGVAHTDGISITYCTLDGGNYTALTPYYYNKSLTVGRNCIKDFGDLNPTPGQYYVSVDGSGNKSGFDASNAMSFEQFKTRVTAIEDIEANKYARASQAKYLDGSCFNFAAGTYSFPDQAALKIGTYAMVQGDGETLRAIAFTLQGVDGTIFDGADTGNIIQVNSVVDLTINGIAFKNAHPGSSNAGGAVYLSNDSSTITLNGCTFDDCYNDASDRKGSGAALNVRTGVLTANDCVFTAGDAHAGGSINVNANGASVEPVATFNNCTVQGSTRGPAIRVTNGTATFNGCTIKDNVHANGSNHGTLLCQGGAEVYVYGCTFSGNTAKEGGAIVCVSNPQVTVGDLGGAHTAFTLNTAANWNGGAIKAKGSGTISVTNATFDTNKALSTSSNSGNGGAIHIEESVGLALSGCSFTGNQSYAYGGALNIIGSGSVTISDCVFDANVSTNQKGTSINIDGDSGAGGATSADLTNCTIKNSNSAKGPAVQIYQATVSITGGSFEDNTNTSGNHGALRIVGGADVTVKGVSFQNNTSGSGGAIFVADASSLTIQDNGTTHTSFTDNSAASYEGGALSIGGSSTASVTGAVFSGNSAKQKAGAVMCKSTGEMSFTDCSFASNKTTSTTFESGATKEYCGGAMYIGEESGNSGSTVLVSNCDFSGNSSATGVASAIHIPSMRVAGSLSVNGCRFTDNGGTVSSGTKRGGVIAIYGTMPVEIRESSFSGNVGNFGACFYVPSSTSLSCSNCVFTGNYTKTDSGNVWNWYGGVLYVEKNNPDIKFDKCYFSGNYSNRAAIAHIEAGGARVWCNDCAMTGNYTVNRSGVLFSLSSTGSEVSLNNCSMSGSYSKYGSNNENSAWIYNSGKLFLSNCTIAGDAKYSTSTKLSNSGHIANCNADGTIHMVNCIDAPATDWCFAIHQKTAWSAAEFFACKMNTYTLAKSNFTLDTSASTLNGENYITSSFGSMSENKPAAGSEAWDKYYWSWNGTMTGTNNTMATLSAVNAKIQNLAPDFYTWLGTVDGLDKDCRGKARGTSTWPGAYDGTNNSGN